MSSRIMIEKAAVYGVATAAAVSFGGGYSCNFRSISKSNVGNGTIVGDRSSMPVWVAWIEDQDTLDTPTWYWSGRPEA